MPPRQRPPRRTTPRSVIWRRRLLAVAVLVAGFALAWFAIASIDGGGTKAQPADDAAAAEAVPDRLSGGLHAGADGASGSEPWRRSRSASAATSRSSEPRATWRRPSGRASSPVSGATRSRAFSSRRPTTSPRKTTSAQLASRQLTAFQRNWSKLNLAYARSKNLTPYDVLIIASMIEEETAAPEERQLVSAVIYNRLHDRMQLGIDATLRYGLHIPPTESIHQSQLETRRPVQHERARRPLRADADADREPGARVAAGCGAPRARRTTSITSASRTSATTSSPRASTRSTPTRPRTATDEPSCVGLLGRAGRGVALAADAERGLRRPRARLGVRPAGDRAEGLERAVAGLRRARLRGGERDDPAQAGGGGASATRPTGTRSTRSSSATAGCSASTPTARSSRGSRRSASA